MTTQVNQKVSKSYVNTVVWHMGQGDAWPMGTDVKDT